MIVIAAGILLALMVLGLLRILLVPLYILSLGSLMFCIIKLVGMAMGGP